ncbi:MAG: DUF2490 domain-containing protein [Chitinophagales bacterium]|nr:DUF2490 domain-containing protein [Chitinophagales bacterium]
MSISAPVRTTVILIFFIGRLGILTVHAQEQDFQTWTSAQINKKISKKIDLQLSQELRLKNNSTQLGTTFTEAGCKYKVRKQLDVAASYRFIVAQDAVSHRVSLDVSYEVEAGHWSAEPRLRYLHQIQHDQPAENYIRPKLSVNYRINKRWEPYVSGELFYHAFYNEGNEFDQYRLSAGFEYSFTKQHAVKLYYLLTQEMNVNNALQRHIAGLSYKYDF